MPAATDTPTARFRDRVRSLWQELEAIEAGKQYDNLEGGSVEQQRDRRLQLHHCANYAAVLALLADAGPNLRLLELGCGSGALSYALARLMPADWQLVATDYSESLLGHARESFRHERLRFELLDVRQAEPGRLAEADIVFLLEVIEHLPQHEAAALLQRLHGAMRPGGRLVLTTLDRSPFKRPFSQYAPHFVEYTFRSLSDFLSDRANSPFESFRVHRITSARIAGESVRNENRGGYLVNRLQRWSFAMGEQYPWAGRMRERLTSAVFRLYSLVPRSQRFDLDGYLETIDFVQDNAESRDSDSFSLVAELRKV